MHILYFHQHFSAPTGAAGIRSYAMAQHLVRHGHKVTMVCGSHTSGDTGLSQPFHKGKRMGTVDGIDVVEFDLAYSNADSFFKRIKLFILFALRSVFISLSLRYDIVFATTTPLTASIPGIVASLLRRKTFIFEVRDLWPELPKAMGVITNPIVLQLMSFLEWLSYHTADRLIGLSPGIVDGIAKRGIAREKIALIPNGCDLNIFATPTKQWRPKGVHEKDLMAVFTGTHGMANGLDAVLDVAQVLKQRKCKNIKIALIGDGKLKPELMLKAQQLGLDNVIFHPPVNKNELVGLVTSADIGLQILANIPAFYYGTSPNKFFDYLAAGLPVLNNYPGWISDIISEHQCGFSVAPEDAAKFADMLEYAVNHRDLLKQMGKNARAVAQMEFNRTDLAQKWSDWVLGDTA